MAARRISKSLTDWAALAERVPPTEKFNFQAFKSRSDGYLRKMLNYPENPPAIDWATYKSKITTPGLVDEFEKAYKNMAVPYPVDKVTPQIDARETEMMKKVEEFVKESEKRIADIQKQLQWWKDMMPFEDMTMEDFRDYFPNHALDPINRPTFWPHTEPAPEGFIMPPSQEH